MKTYETSREIAAPPERVFAAFAAERLARWWGPSGFTNTFSVFEFKTGGRWIFVMHGPDGKNYPNESVFAEIVPNAKVVVDHAKPQFRLTIGLAATPKGTRVSWSQAFDDEQVARMIEHIVVPANEQNLDRLAAEVARG